MSPEIEAARELILDGDSYLRLRPFVADRPNEPRELLIENRMWFSAISNQDDIFEGRPVFVWRDSPASLDDLREVVRRRAPDKTEEEREAIARDFFQKTQDSEFNKLAKQDFERRYLEIYRASSIACFFTDPFGVRNWADYADRGRGYGLLFDLSIPWRFEGFEGMPPSEWAPFEVNYVARDARPTVELAFGPADPRTSFNDIERALLTKSDEWREQREQRFVRVGIAGGHVSFPPESLKALVLGHSIEPANREALIALARERELPIAVFESGISDRHLAIDLRPIEV